MISNDAVSRLIAVDRATLVELLALAMNHDQRKHWGDPDMNDLWDAARSIAKSEYSTDRAFVEWEALSLETMSIPE